MKHEQNLSSKTQSKAYPYGGVWEHKVASEENIKGSPGGWLTCFNLPPYFQPLPAGRHPVPRHCPNPGCLTLGSFGARVIKGDGLFGSLLVSQVPSYSSQEVYLLHKTY